MILNNDEIKSEEEIIEALKKLNKLGSKNISVTLGSKGSISLIDGNIYVVDPIRIKPISVVGAGDSFVAGFIHGYVNGFDNTDKLILATACATATATTYKLATKNLIEYYKENVIVNKK